MLLSIGKGTAALVIGFARDVLGIFAIVSVLVSMSGIMFGVVTNASVLVGIVEDMLGEATNASVLVSMSSIAGDTIVSVLFVMSGMVGPGAEVFTASDTLVVIELGAVTKRIHIHSFNWRYILVGDTV